MILHIVDGFEHIYNPEMKKPSGSMFGKLLTWKNTGLAINSCDNRQSFTLNIRAVYGELRDDAAG